MITEKEETINGLRIHYRLAGNTSNKPLIFLAAWGAHIGKLKFINGTDNAIEEFSKDFYVISVEHAGLMRSEIPLKGWQFEDYVEIVNSILKKLNISKAIFVGNSFGGAVATEFAKKYSNKIIKLILVDSVVNKDYEQTGFSKNNYRIIYTSVRLKYFPIWVKKLCVWLFLGIPFKYINPKDFKNLSDFVEESGKRVLDVDYSQLTVSTLLLWGNKDHNVHPVDYARDIAKKLPYGKLVEYGGSVATIYKKPRMIKDLIIRSIQSIL